MNVKGIKRGHFRFVNVAVIISDTSIRRLIETIKRISRIDITKLLIRFSAKSVFILFRALCGRDNHKAWISTKKKNLTARLEGSCVFVYLCKCEYYSGLSSFAQRSSLFIGLLYLMNSKVDEPANFSWSILHQFSNKWEKKLSQIIWKINYLFIYSYSMSPQLFGY